MSDASSLYDLAGELLAACEDVLGWTHRAYVSNGEPAYDCCPQLVTYVTGVRQASANPTAGTEVGAALRVSKAGGRIVLADMLVDIIGCVPVGNLSGEKYVPPSVDSLQVAHEVLYRWAWRLWNGLATRKREGLNFAPVCEAFDLGVMVPITPEGGCSGWRIPVVVHIHGYDELGGLS